MRFFVRNEATTNRSRVTFSPRRWSSQREVWASSRTICELLTPLFLSVICSRMFHASMLHFTSVTGFCEFGNIGFLSDAAAITDPCREMDKSRKTRTATRQANVRLTIAREEVLWKNESELTRGFLSLDCGFLLAQCGFLSDRQHVFTDPVKIISQFSR